MHCATEIYIYIYIYIYMVSRSLVTPRRSKLANCKFIIELVICAYRSKQKAPKEETLNEIEPVISSIMQGPAKITIKIN